MAVTLTTEEKTGLAGRLQGHRKLVNKSTFLELIHMGDSNWQRFWCGAPEHESPTLGVNDGFMPAPGHRRLLRRPEQIPGQDRHGQKRPIPSWWARPRIPAVRIGQLTVRNMSCQDNRGGPGSEDRQGPVVLHPD